MHACTVRASFSLAAALWFDAKRGLFDVGGARSGGF
jgi:hypothetical protein